MISVGKEAVSEWELLFYCKKWDRKGVICSRAKPCFLLKGGTQLFECLLFNTGDIRARDSQPSGDFLLG